MKNITEIGFVYARSKKQNENIMFFLRDNPITLMVISYLMIWVGQLMGFRLLLAVTQLIPTIAATDAWVTAGDYLMFVGIWAVALFLLVLIPDNRPMLKALGKKVKGNTLKMFAVGLAIGLEGAVTSVVVSLIASGLIVWWGTKRKTVPTDIWGVKA